MQHAHRRSKVHIVEDVSSHRRKVERVAPCCLLIEHGRPSARAAETAGAKSASWRTTAAGSSTAAAARRWPIEAAARRSLRTRSDTDRFADAQIHAELPGASD